MRLLLDAGNSRVKWRRLGGAPDEGAMAWSDLEQVLPSVVEGVREVWCCLPGQEARRQALYQVLRRYGLEPRLPERAELEKRLRPAYARPERMGLDRLLALTAAHAQWPGEALIVIDAGTAVTLDALDDTGHHAGGMIVPGLRLLGEALAHEAGLPAMPPAAWAEAIHGQDTEAALAGGLRALVEGGLERLIRSLECGLLAEQPRLLLTGGDARWVEPLLGRPARLCQNLVLDGLALESEC